MKYKDSKSCLGYLNKLVDEYNNTYHCSISKKSVDANNYSALTKEIETHLKVSKFKVHHRVRITQYKNSFSKVYTENWSREIFFIDSVLKTNS